MKGLMSLGVVASMLCQVISATSNAAKATTPKAPETTTANMTTTTMKPVGNLYMHQAHGIFMLTAFMLCYSFAIMISRYYRVAFPKKKLFGKQVWFQLHTFFNVLGLVLTGISIVVIFSAVRGISGFKWFRPLFTKAHPYMGMVVTGLLFFNALISLCRSSQRTMFNWVHWFLGIVSYIVGMVTVFSGLNMSSFCPQWTIWVMLAWTGFDVVICIILELQKCFGKQISDKVGFPSVYSPIPEGLGKEEKQGAAAPGEKDTLLHGAAKPGDRGNVLRYWLLALWIIVTLTVYGVLFWGILTGSFTGI